MVKRPACWLVVVRKNIATPKKLQAKKIHMYTSISSCNNVVIFDIFLSTDLYKLPFISLG